MSEVEERIGAYGVVPVAVVEDASDAVPLARALASGGLPCVEVTFRTAAAPEAIAAIAAGAPDVLVGAGTVLSVGQAERAVDSGARFVVSPGFDAEVVDWCLGRGVDVFPGCATASEVTQAYRRGIRAVKFFPCAALGGLPAIRALAAPFSGLRFVPTGGINAKNVGEYLACERVLACGATWVAPAAVVAAGDFAEVGRRAREVASVVGGARGQ